MFNIFKRNKKLSLNELEQYRQDYGIVIIDDNPLNIRSVCGLNLSEIVLETCKITGFSFEAPGYYDSSLLIEYLFVDDHQIRNQRFHEQISVVSARLAKEYSEKNQAVYNVLVTLQEYLDLFYSQKN